MTADLQDLFDQAGRNPPVGALDADAVLRRARHVRNRRVGAVAATLAATVALGVGLAGQHLLSAAPLPTTPLPTPLPTAQAEASLGRLAYGIDGDIYLADWDGKNPVRIADGAPRDDDHCGGYWAEGPMWSPDGRYLAYRGNSTGDVTPTRVLCSRTVNISDPEGHLVTSFPGEGWAIAWSPDSTRVAAWVDFYPGTRIGIYGLDGVRQALLTVPAGLMANGDFDPVWSPDGKSLLLPFGVEIPVDGSTPRQLPAEDPRSQWFVEYSPNGADVAYIPRSFSGDVEIEGPSALTVAAVDGSQVRVLVPGGVQTFVWSPTGDRISFGSYSTDLAVVDVASGDVRSLVHVDGGTLGVIAFSPEGDRILFTRTDAAGVTSLWSVHADGSDPRRLVAGSDRGADWQVIPTR